jgi:thiamine biosynthesis lipoprotein
MARNQTRTLMGMPITVDIRDAGATQDTLDRVFAYLIYVDEKFSTYKPDSEISRINRGEIMPDEFSEDMRSVLALSELTRIETGGYFDIRQNGILDPSGLVKGWAIQQVADMVLDEGWRNFYVDAGGDVQAVGLNAGRPWRIGIRNPFNRHENVKVLSLSNLGVATSGTAVRGQHIYDPFHPDYPLLDIVSMTVIGPNAYEADRFATAAFAMGTRGIFFIEELPGFEGYMIDCHARATSTRGFERHVLNV